MGMVGVDKIGEIRRAYFEQELSIKEIVRTLSVSRATVRKVIRGHQTEFKYARDIQPTPKLGEWVEALTEILEAEANLPKSLTQKKSCTRSGCVILRFRGGSEMIRSVDGRASRDLQACRRAISERSHG
jgi:transposase-like protein